jgi:4a-hydroxytetrahydrobiopterin dehydratase
MTRLCDLSCKACRGDMPAVKGERLAELCKEVPDWDVIDEHHLVRTFALPDFKTALGFVNRVGALAEEEGHHPEILLSWGRVRVELHTHKIDALTDSDFILAAKIDRL